MDYDSSQTSNENTNLFFPLRLIIYLCPFVFLFQLSLASVSIWFTHWLSFSRGCCCSLQHCYSSFRCPSVSILHCDSLFPSPLFHSVCHFASLSLSPLLSPLLSSLLGYPNAFIFPPLPTFIQFVFLSSAVSIFFSRRSNSRCPLSLLSPSLFIIISQQFSSIVFAKHGVFIFC